MRAVKLWTPVALAAATVSALALSARPATAGASGRHAPAAAGRPATAPPLARSAALARL